MEWKAKPTGNMTLALCDGKRVILSIDMLTQNILPPGDNGHKLCVALNDLSLIANAVSTADGEIFIKQLPYAEDGFSPTPWTAGIDSHKLFVRDSNGRLICSKAITHTNSAQLRADFDLLLIALLKINAITFLAKA
jgi:hypothetical protein